MPRRSARATIVTSGDDAKLERAKALGADVCFNYKTTPDWHKQARAAGPIDVVVDSSGGDTLAKAIDAIRPGGRIAIYGGTTADANVKLFPLFWKHVTILGTSMGSPSDFRAMLALFDGTIKPAIDKVFPFGEAVAAAQRMASSEQFGKNLFVILSGIKTERENRVSARPAAPVRIARRTVSRRRVFAERRGEKRRFVSAATSAPSRRRANASVTNVSTHALSPSGSISHATSGANSDCSSPVKTMFGNPDWANKTLPKALSSVGPA